MMLYVPKKWVYLLVMSGLLMSACNDDDDDDTDIPQLTAATASTRATSCESLSTFSFANTTITTASTVAAGVETQANQAIGEHCLITGKMYERVSSIDGKSYAIGFEMRLPTDWNGRYFYQANGGIDGSVRTALGETSGGGPLTGALLQGFAVISSDAGHSPAMPTFGYDPQARLDYGYQAVAKLTPMAKALIELAYERGPDRSYFGGCSNGGRHTLVAASRYADDYDGFLIGAPGYNLPKAALANIAGAQQYASIEGTSSSDLSESITATERTLVADAILAACDTLDGLADGMVQAREACQSAFDLDSAVTTCSGNRDGYCLTAEQKQVLATIFAGVETSNGDLVYADFPWDPGLNSSGVMFWEYNASVALDPGAVGMVFKTPPVALTDFNIANFDANAFALSADIDTLANDIEVSNTLYTESAMSFMTPPNPTDLSNVKARGAKIIAYHGTADAIFSLNDTIAWYDGLDSNHDGDASAFAQLYPVPGMGHCSGGPATDQFDLLTPLVAWVEQGETPEAVVAAVRGQGNAGGVNDEIPQSWSAERTRPLCPYPQVAQYNGSGDSESASSFACE